MKPLWGNDYISGKMTWECNGIRPDEAGLVGSALAFDPQIMNIAITVNDFSKYCRDEVMELWWHFECVGVFMLIC